MTHGWPLVPLGEILIEYKEYIEAPEARVYPKLSVKLYGKGVILDTSVDGATLKMQRHQLAKAGQVILSEIWGKKGAIGFVPLAGEGALCTSHFFLFDVNESQVLQGWLDVVFRANYLAEQLDARAFGTTGYAAVRPKDLLAATIPLPPLPEQQRIVARIERLAAKIEEARGARTQSDSITEQMWKSCTAAAIVTLEEDTKRPIAEIAEVRGGLQKSPSRTPGDHPIRYLTVAHVQRNRVLVSDPRFFEVAPAELDSWKLYPGDVLIIEGNGSADQIGRTALFRGEIDPCVHQNHVIRIRPDRDRVDPEFLNAFLNSPLGQEEVQSRSRTTSGLRSLSVGRIKEVKVPLPPLAEQRRIVAYLDSLQVQADRLKALQSRTAADLDALLPAILDRAFRGEL